MISMLQKYRVCLATALVFLLLPATSGHAAEGTIEINHAAALEGGVTPGDLAGYPVTIGAAGSYVLTGNLAQPDADTHVIEILADGVYLDLAGFEITGSNSCSAGVCTGNGMGDGVSGETASEVSVVNGRIAGMGHDGILLGARSRVSGIRASNNGRWGIRANDDSVITMSTGVSNGSVGVRVEAGGQVIDCISVVNGGSGVSLGPDAMARGNVVRDNVGNGIAVLLGTAKIQGNLIQGNLINGIDGEGGLIEHNEIRDNTGFGVIVRDKTGVMRANMLTGNNGGDANPQTDDSNPTATLAEIGTNWCGTDTTCP